jgi:hypothetical protein
MRAISYLQRSSRERRRRAGVRLAPCWEGEREREGETETEREKERETGAHH